MTGSLNSVACLLERLPEGYCRVAYGGRAYGVTKSVLAAGRSLKVYAEELGGPDLISANLYLTGHGEEFRPCEMPAAKVIAFLEGWTPSPS